MIDPLGQAVEGFLGGCENAGDAESVGAVEQDAQAFPGTAVILNQRDVDHGGANGGDGLAKSRA